jgi:hypothetical protein
MATLLSILGLILLLAIVKKVMEHSDRDEYDKDDRT